MTRHVPTVLAASLLAATACQAGVPALPWVHGLDDAVASTGVGAPQAPSDVEPAEGCGVAASRTIELVADFAPAAGRETILASYSRGIAVLDREDRLLVETPGYACEGSADELEVVAVGAANGERILAIAATSGGHREAVTWVSLFRVPSLQVTFTGVVETRDEDRTLRGAIYFVPGGLLYRRPGGPFTFWRLDPDVRIYVPVLPETPHDEPAEPPIISRR